MSVSDDLLKEFIAIDGFQGVALFTPSGEELAIMEASGTKHNLKNLGILANTVLMNAQKASIEMGTGRGQMIHVMAEKAEYIVRCLNEGNDPIKTEPGKAHIHLVLVLDKDANVGLAKMKIASIIEKLAEYYR